MKKEFKLTIEDSDTQVERQLTKTETAKKFTVYIQPDDYIFLKKNAWEYESMNGFIVHLIQEERKRRGE